MLDMENLYRAVMKGEHSLPHEDLQAALTAEKKSGECERGGHAGIVMTLENLELWKQFDSVTNEMIVTKAGR